MGGAGGLSTVRGALVGCQDSGWNFGVAIDSRTRSSFTFTFTFAFTFAFTFDTPLAPAASLSPDRAHWTHHTPPLIYIQHYRPTSPVLEPSSRAPSVSCIHVPACSWAPFTNNMFLHRNQKTLISLTMKRSGHTNLMTT